MFPIKGNNRPVSAGAGFSLLELMVGLSLAFTIMVATLAAYAFIGRNFTRMANTQRVEALSRRAFAQLGKDVHAATQITSALATSLELKFSSGKTVTYTYAVPSGTEYNRGVLTRTASPVSDPDDYSTVLLTNIDTTVHTTQNTQTSLQFNYFDTSGNPTTTLASIKEVELTFFSAYTTDKKNSTDNLKKSAYAAVSSRVALSNRIFLQ
jgi:hypothetical protein